MSSGFKDGVTTENWTGCGECGDGVKRPNAFKSGVSRAFVRFCGESIYLYWWSKQAGIESVRKSKRCGHLLVYHIMERDTFPLERSSGVLPWNVTVYLYRCSRRITSGKALPLISHHAGKGSGSEAGSQDYQRW